MGLILRIWVSCAENGINNLGLNSVGKWTVVPYRKWGVREDPAQMDRKSALPSTLQLDSSQHTDGCRHPMPLGWHHCHFCISFR